MWNTPLMEGEVRPEQKLAVAVLTLALDDARTARLDLKQAAIDWLQTDSRELDLWCAITGTTPSAIRAHLAFLCSSGNVSRRRPLRRWTCGPPGAVPESAPRASSGSRGRTGDEGP